MIGVVCSIVFGIIRLLKYDKAHAINEKLNSNLDESDYEDHENQSENNHVIYFIKFNFQTLTNTSLKSNEFNRSKDGKLNVF